MTDGWIDGSGWVGGQWVVGSLEGEWRHLRLK